MFLSDSNRIEWNFLCIFFKEMMHAQKPFQMTRLKLDTIPNFASRHSNEQTCCSHHEEEKKLHEKCTRHESTRVQLPFAFSSSNEKREKFRRDSESQLAQKAPRESLFRCCCLLAVEVLLSRSTTYCNYRAFLHFFSRAKTSSHKSLICVIASKMAKRSSALKCAKSRRIPCFPDCMQ